MGNKKKKYQVENQDSIDPSISPYDDPYWVLPESYIPVSNNSRVIEQFNRMRKKFPVWADDLISGYPTYYGMLGVMRGDDAQTVKDHYEFEISFPSFPPHTINEAYSVLSNVLKRTKYDELLNLFLKGSIHLPPDVKKMTYAIHKEHLDNAKSIRRLNRFKQSYNDYLLLIGVGMPDIFMVSNLSHDCSDKAIEKYSVNGDEISLLISSILKDSSLREEFIFVSDYFEHILSPEKQEQRNEAREKWKNFPSSLVRKVLYQTLTSSEQLFENLSRIEKNINENHDWKEYLPPSDESFFSVLGVSEDISSLSKGEFEASLRLQYRTLDRTPVVNLAYSVLKNPGLREEYFWMRENYYLMTIVDGLDIFEDDEDIDDYEFFDNDEDDEGSLFDEFSPEEILALLRKLKMGF